MEIGSSMIVSFQALRHRPTSRLQSEYTGSRCSATRKLGSMHDLSVHTSSDAIFYVHIARMATLCRRTVGSFRSFKARSKDTPTEDICSQSSGLVPSVKFVTELEVIQRVYIKEIDSVKQMSSWERLPEVKLYPLERRQARYAVTYIWKILEGFASIESHRCIILKMPSSSFQKDPVLQ